MLDVIPMVAAAMLAVLDLQAPPGQWRQPGLTPMQLTLLIGSLLVLGGVPILEEILRTQRAARRADNHEIERARPKANAAGSGG